MTAPWLEDSALRPQRERTTMASADFSPPFPGRCRPRSRKKKQHRQAVRSPRVRRDSFRRASPDLPVRLPDGYGASSSTAELPSRTGLVSGFCSSSPTFASGFLPTLPRDDAVAFGYQFPPSGPGEDFHLIRFAPCLAHRHRGGAPGTPPLFLAHTHLARQLLQPAETRSFCRDCLHDVDDIDPRVRGAVVEDPLGQILDPFLVQIEVSGL